MTIWDDIRRLEEEAEEKRRQHQEITRLKNEAENQINAYWDEAERWWFIKSYEQMLGKRRTYAFEFFADKNSQEEIEKELNRLKSLIDRERIADLEALIQEYQRSYEDTQSFLVDKHRKMRNLVFHNEEWPGLTDAVSEAWEEIMGRWVGGLDKMYVPTEEEILGHLREWKDLAYFITKYKKTLEGQGEEIRNLNELVEIERNNFKEFLETQKTWYADRYSQEAQEIEDNGEEFEIGYLIHLLKQKEQQAQAEKLGERQKLLQKIKQLTKRDKQNRKLNHQLSRARERISVAKNQERERERERNAVQTDLTECTNERDNWNNKFDKTRAEAKKWKNKYKSIQKGLNDLRNSISQEQRTYQSIKQQLNAIPPDWQTQITNANLEKSQTQIELDAAIKDKKNLQSQLNKQEKKIVQQLNNSLQLGLDEDEKNLSKVISEIQKLINKPPFTVTITDEVIEIQIAQQTISALEKQLTIDREPSCFLTKEQIRKELEKEILQQVKQELISNDLNVSYEIKQQIQQATSYQQAINAHKQKFWKNGNYQTIKQQNIVTEQKNELTKSKANEVVLISGLVTSLIVIGGLLVKIKTKKSQKNKGSNGITCF